MQLQSRCYFQLTEDEMPSKASKSIESQLTMLIKAAKGKLVLLCLDDMWSREHAEPFDCLDDNGSKLLVTTRLDTTVLKHCAFDYCGLYVSFVLGSKA